MVKRPDRAGFASGEDESWPGAESTDPKCPWKPSSFPDTFPATSLSYPPGRKHSHMQHLSKLGTRTDEQARM